MFFHLFIAFCSSSLTIITCLMHSTSLVFAVATVFLFFFVREDLLVRYLLDSPFFCIYKNNSNNTVLSAG